MKFLKIKDFLKCPCGTVFQEIGDEESRIIESLRIKTENVNDDDFFYYQVTPDWNFTYRNDSKECIEWSQTWSRWGRFDETAMFMVYEKKDIQHLKNILDGMEEYEEKYWIIDEDPQ